MGAGEDDDSCDDEHGFVVALPGGVVCGLGSGEGDEGDHENPRITLCDHGAPEDTCDCAGC